MENIWEQLICQTCGSNAVEIVDGLLCCKACKSKHTLQEKISEEEVIALNVATTDRNAYKFEDALEKYEQLLKKYPDNEAANWGALLADYGIAYVKDYDGKFIPTCHRLNERPIDVCPYYYKLNDGHKAQAQEIEKLRLSIMSKANKIQPYDVFICYKATEDVFGRSVSTKEAGWAREIYTMLKHKLNLRVFFAEESLTGENSEWEPHIYKALNTARLMFVLTTGKQNVNAVWVKNEWKRYSRYIKEGQDKTIRVVYDIMNAYDLPKELQDTQAIHHNSMSWGEAVRKAVENIFEKKKEKPTAKKETEGTARERELEEELRKTREAMAAMQARMQELQNEVNEQKAVPKFPLSSVEFTIENGILMKYEGYAKEVIIPDGVIGIGKNAFEDCKRISSITIPNSVTAIGDFAFGRCKALKNINIPDSVTSIGSKVFWFCDSLTSITIPDSVVNMGESIFTGCEKLANIKFNGTIEQWNSISKEFYWNYVPATEVICTDGTVSI